MTTALRAIGRAADPAVSVQQLGKSFGARPVLERVSLQVGAGELVALVGRSGCGKTTLLRILAGLERPDAGQVQHQEVPGHPAGSVRMVFQEARLLPWRTVAENVALGAAPGALDGAAVRARVTRALQEVGLAGRERDWPAILSGGQRQRVALARALVSQPRLLLLDEPLGALDALTRLEMQELIERIWRAQRFAAVLVTHDVEEAVALADRVLLLEQGRVTLELPVDLPRPRPHHGPALARLVTTLLARLRGEGAAPTSQSACD